MTEIDIKDKNFEIVVNGEKHVVHDSAVTYEELVKLAFPTPPEGVEKYTVTFYGARKPVEGSLKPEKSVEIGKQGAVFNVTPTTKS